MTTNSLLSKAAIPYAEALFESSKFCQSIEKTSSDLKFINHIISQTYNLKDFLSNPLVTQESKKKVIKKLFTNQVNVNVLNFLLILVERRRMILLSSIIDAYLALVYQLNLIIIVDLYSVVVLTEIQRKILEQKLQIITKCKEIKLNVHIKPELIGGFIIKIGSKIIDMSIYGQLNQIASYLNVTYI